MIARRCLLAAATMAAAVLPPILTGCGRHAVPVYSTGGKVVFPDGKPLGGGWVWTRPVQGKDIPGARGQIQPDGSFELGTYRPGDGAVEGEHLVLVSPPLLRGDRAEMLKRPKIIDPRFESFDTSRLKFAVTRDPAKNQFALRIDCPRQ